MTDFSMKGRHLQSLDASLGATRKDQIQGEMRKYTITIHNFRDL